MKKLFLLVLILILLSSFGYADISTSDVISYYKADTNGSYPDAHSSNNGSAIGDPTFTTSGKIVNAYIYDGNDYHDIPESIVNGVGQDGDIVFVGWFYPTTTGKAFLGYGIDSTNYGFCNVQADNTIRCINKISNSWQTATVTTNTVTQNSWNFIAIRYHGTNIDMQINSNLETNMTNGANNRITEWTSINSLGIGAAGVTGGVQGDWVGNIDEPAFYTDLTTTKINDLYNSDNGSQYPFSVDILNITELLLISPSPDQNLTLSGIIGNTTDTTPSFQLKTNIAATSFDINGTTACTNNSETRTIWTCTHSTVLSVGMHNITMNGTDGTTNVNITREINVSSVPSISINLSLSDFTKNITAELGSKILIDADIDTGYIVCVDINHTTYGTNYSCAVNTTIFNLSMDYFNELQYTREVCYQEFANLSYDCGAVSYTGGNPYLVIDVGASNIVNGSNSYDGNYSTFAYQTGISDPGFIYINYTKPTDALRNSLFQIKTGTTFQNYTIPEACFLNSPLQFRVGIFLNTLYNGQTVNATQISCNPTTGPSKIISTILGTYDFYDEAMYWYLSDDSLTIPVNTTINLTSHQYAEVLNLSLYLTALDDNDTYPSNVKIYINDTLSNNIGDVVGTLVEFEDSSTSMNVTFTDEETPLIGYFKLPKNTDVQTATFNITGYNYTYLQVEPDNRTVDDNNNQDIYLYTYYEKKNRTIVNWEYSLGTVTNYTPSSACINASNDWMLFSFKGIDGSSTSTVEAKCNGVNIATDNGADGYYSKSDTSFAHGRDTIKDGDYTTFGCPVQIGFGNVFWARQWVRSGASINCEDLNIATVYDSQVWWESFTLDPWIQIGELDGVNEWDYTGLYSDEEEINDFSTQLETYLFNCVADEHGYCNVPVYVYSNIGGIIQINNINIDYTVDIMISLIIVMMKQLSQS